MYDIRYKHLCMRKQNFLQPSPTASPSSALHHAGCGRWTPALQNAIGECGPWHSGSCGRWRHSAGGSEGRILPPAPLRTDRQTTPWSLSFCPLHVPKYLSVVAWLDTASFWSAHIQSGHGFTIRSPAIYFIKGFTVHPGTSQTYQKGVYEVWPMSFSSLVNIC